MKNKYSELQEIIFWQQLNKQIISLRSKGQGIKDEHQDFLQKFSFKHNLFSKITSAHLLDNIPLALITNFSNICFISIKIKSWNDCLKKLIQNSFVLDLEKALADAFEAVKDHEKKFVFNRGAQEQDGEEGDDSEEFYGFIEYYLKEKETRFNFEKILFELYGLKAKFIKQLMQLPEYLNLLEIKDNILFFNLDAVKRKKELIKMINKNYKNFLWKTDCVVNWFFIIIDTCAIRNLLEKNIHEENIETWIREDTKPSKIKNIKHSIREFAEHELAIYKKEYKLLSDFQKRLPNKFKNNEKKFLKVAICSLSPYKFLKDPFPLI